MSSAPQVYPAARRFGDVNGSRRHGACNAYPTRSRMSGSPFLVRKAAVLGAGTMGAQIAAHLANAGVPVLLLDLNAEVARDGWKRAAALRPDPFFTRDAAALVTTGGLDADLHRLGQGDWIVEAGVEP